MEETERFQNILIVGIGLIGGSLGLALKRKGYNGKIIGVDKKEVLERVKKRNFLDAAYPNEDLSIAAAEADLVFLCMPINGIIETLQMIGSYVKPNTLITDVGSTKRKIVETANIFLPADVDFIGGHPMAGSEFRGIEAADPFLFENTTYVLTPSKPVDEGKRRAFGELLERIGAKVLLLLPSLHDEIAAAVSHLPQLAAVALMSMVADRQAQSPHFLKMAAGGFRDMTRISSSPYGIWEDILATNADMIVNYIDSYIRELEKVRDLVVKPEMEKYFDKAARNRLSIPKDTKGFLRPHYDLIISVEDKPGVVYNIASVLYEKNLNIKDIEILKIREDEGGTMRLAFSTEDDREQALALLQQKGFDCRKRE